MKKIWNLNLVAYLCLVGAALLTFGYGLCFIISIASTILDYVIIILLVIAILVTVIGSWYMIPFLVKNG